MREDGCTRSGRGPGESLAEEDGELGPGHAPFAAARDHWTIENGLHWVLDVVFDEDQARNRKDNGPENLAILRKLAFNVLTQARPASPSGANENDPDGPTSSPDPSSAKCDSPEAGPLQS